MQPGIEQNKELSPKYQDEFGKKRTHPALLNLAETGGQDRGR
jgi:hypothetical protein